MATKADTTLVQAAFKEGQTRFAQPNMKPIFDATAAIQKTYADTLGNIMKTVAANKAKKKAATAKKMKPVKANMKTINEKLMNGEALPEGVIDWAINKTLKLQKQAEDVAKKGDTLETQKEMMKIMREYNTLENEIVKTRKEFMIATQDPDDYNDPRIKDDDVDHVNIVAEYMSGTPARQQELIDGGQIRIGTGDDGRLTFFTDTSGEIRGHTEPLVEKYDPKVDSDPSKDMLVWEGGSKRSYNSTDIQNALPYENLETDVAVGEWHEPAGALGKTHAEQGAANKYINPNALNTEEAEFMSIFNTDEDYYDATGRRLIENKASFEQAMGGMVEIPLAVLSTMFIDENGNTVTDMETYFAELDASSENPDGIINSDDFPEKGKALDTFMNNLELVKDEILDSKEIGLPMMAKYYAGLKKKLYEDNYNANVTGYNKLKQEKELKINQGGGGGGGGGGLNNLSRTTTYKNMYYGPRGKTIHGNQLNGILDQFKSGTIKTNEGTFIRDETTNIWTNPETQATKSGNEMIAMWQGEIPEGGHSLQLDLNFKQFRGDEGSSKKKEQSDKDISAFFGPNANEENAVDKLSILYPHLKIYSPVGWKEKINVNGRMFYLRGKGNSTPKMEMKRLQEYIKTIDPLDPK